MIQTLIGKKIEQTQKFLEDGRRIPVTEIAVSENAVVQVKTVEKDGYSAMQLGFGARKKPIKAVLGHAKKAGLSQAPLKIKEVRVAESDIQEAGALLKVEEVFKPGDIVAVTGTSKGKGFAGVVKRYNFRGGPKTHGQSDRHRAPGSIGQTTTPGRVYKGKRMAGHMGVDTVTVTNLTVVDVDAENKKLYVSGLVPGHKNSLLTIELMGEDKKFVQLLEVKQREDAKAAEEAAKIEAETPVEEAGPEVGEATEDVKVETAEEAVVTPEETVETAPETVETPEEAVEAPAEASNEAEVEKSDEVKEDLVDSENVEEGK